MTKTGKHTKLYDLMDDAGGARKVNPDLERERIRRELERARILTELDQIKLRRVTNARSAQIIAESELKEELARRKLEELRHPEPKRSQQATPSPYQVLLFNEKRIALLEYIRTHPESVNTPEEFEKAKEYIFKKKGTL